MFRHILHHPQGELLSPAQNYVLIVMLLQWLQNIRYINCGFCNVTCNYYNNNRLVVMSNIYIKC